MEYIDDFFRTHLFIEFFFKHDKMFLSEHMQPKENLHLLLEQYSVFPGCYEMASELNQKVNELPHKNNSKITVTFNNDWVKDVNLMYFDKVSEAAYWVDGSKWNYNDSNFKEITIFLNIPKIQPDSLIPLLMHELTHAYQDYKFRVNGSSYLEKARKQGTSKNPTIRIGSYEELKQKLAWILYHMNDMERSAYISQIEGVLKNTDKVFKDINEVWNFIKNTVVYRNYQTVFNWINEFEEIDDGVTQSKIMSWVEELSGLEFLSYPKFLKYLKKKQREYTTKFNKMLPKLSYNHLTMLEFASPTVNYLIG